MACNFLNQLISDCITVSHLNLLALDLLLFGLLLVLHHLTQLGVSGLVLCLKLLRHRTKYIRKIVRETTRTIGNFKVL